MSETVMEPLKSIFTFDFCVNLPHSSTGWKVTFDSAFIEQAQFLVDTGADVQVQAYDWDDVLGGFFLAPGVPTNREVKKDVSRQKKKKK